MLQETDYYARNYAHCARLGHDQQEYFVFYIILESQLFRGLGAATNIMIGSRTST